MPIQGRPIFPGRSLNLPVALILVLLAIVTPAVAADRPNVVILLADDLGVGDLSRNGSPIRTPSLDRLADEGVSMSQFYASANVCTPSRAGLLTGRYAIRMGLAWQVLEADSTHGLPPEELTLAELLGDAGYRTALVGKWHLGHGAPYWPTRHGFDSFFGIPYSNDMSPLALYRGDRVVEDPVNQARLTRRFTDEAVAFIRDAAGAAPFFLYLAYSAPHIPLAVTPDRAGRSPAGRYGDVVEELDDSVGEVLAALQETGQTDNTLVVFTSDNGAWFEGSNGPFRNMKGLPWDGGYRVPLLARLPGVLPAGVRSDALSMNIDLLPTIGALTGVDLPPGLELDGRNVLPAWRGEGASPHELLVLFQDEDVAALRTPRWKYLVRAYYRHNYVAYDRFEPALGFAYPQLYDMKEPFPERYSRADEHPDIVRALEAELSRARATFEPMRTRPPRPALP